MGRTCMSLRRMLHRSRDALSDAQRLDLEAHLEQCSACASDADLIGNLRSVIAQIPSRPLTPHRIERAMEAAFTVARLLDRRRGCHSPGTRSIQRSAHRRRSRCKANRATGRTGRQPPATVDVIDAIGEVIESLWFPDKGPASLPHPACAPRSPYRMWRQRCAMRCRIFSAMTVRCSCS